MWYKKCWNAKTTIWWRHTSVFYNQSIYGWYRGLWLEWEKQSCYLGEGSKTYHCASSLLFQKIQDSFHFWCNTINHERIMLFGELMVQLIPRCKCFKISRNHCPWYPVFCPFGVWGNSSGPAKWTSMVHNMFSYVDIYIYTISDTVTHEHNHNEKRGRTYIITTLSSRA